MCGARNGVTQTRLMHSDKRLTAPWIPMLGLRLMG